MNCRKIYFIKPGWDFYSFVLLQETELLKDAVGNGGKVNDQTTKDGYLKIGKLLTIISKTKTICLCIHTIKKKPIHLKAPLVL